MTCHTTLDEWYPLFQTLEGYPVMLMSFYYCIFSQWPRRFSEAQVIWKLSWCPQLAARARFTRTPNYIKCTGSGADRVQMRKAWLVLQQKQPSEQNQVSSAKLARGSSHVRQIVPSGEYLNMCFWSIHFSLSNGSLHPPLLYQQWNQFHKHRKQLKTLLKG